MNGVGAFSDAMNVVEQSNDIMTMLHLLDVSMRRCPVCRFNTWELSGAV